MSKVYRVYRNPVHPDQPVTPEHPEQATPPAPAPAPTPTPAPATPATPSETAMNEPSVRYNLGMFEMLCDAIRQHVRLHHGRMPLYFILHPEVWKDLVVNLTPRQKEYVDFDARTTTYAFMSVRVQITTTADRPKLINTQNVIVYL